MVDDVAKTSGSRFAQGVFSTSYGGFCIRSTMAAAPSDGSRTGGGASSLSCFRGRPRFFFFSTGSFHFFAVALRGPSLSDSSSLRISSSPSDRWPLSGYLSASCLFTARKKSLSLTLSS
jgi:hypothetical protein